MKSQMKMRNILLKTGGKYKERIMENVMKWQRTGLTCSSVLWKVLLGSDENGF